MRPSDHYLGKVDNEKIPSGCCFHVILWSWCILCCSLLSDSNSYQGHSRLLISLSRKSLWVQTRRLPAIHAPCSLHFLLQNLVTFPVIFPASFGIFRAPASCGFLCWQGPCFTKFLISKLNLNEKKTQLVIKAMLKTSNSAFIIELSIRNLPLVYMSNALSGHISLLKEFTCKIHQFRLYPAHLIVIYIFRVYIYTLFGAHHHIGVYYMGTGQARLSCLYKELIQIDLLKYTCTCSSYALQAGEWVNMPLLAVWLMKPIPTDSLNEAHNVRMSCIGPLGKPRASEITVTSIPFGGIPYCHIEHLSRVDTDANKDRRKEREKGRHSNTVIKEK